MGGLKRFSSRGSTAARRAVPALAALLFLLPGGGTLAQSGGYGAMKGPPPPAPATGGQISVTGTIARIEGSTLFLSAADGTTSPVAIGKDTLILERLVVPLSSIQNGDALGVAATKAADGSLTATAINVFPKELWQRARKGQFAMSNGQVMTNAEVDRLAAQVTGGILYLKYDMLSAAIAVPEGIVIHRSYARSLADLKPGMTVTARGSPGPGGLLVAGTVNLEGAPG